VDLLLRSSGDENGPSHRERRARKLVHRIIRSESRTADISALLESFLETSSNGFNRKRVLFGRTVELSEDGSEEEESPASPRTTAVVGRTIEVLDMQDQTAHLVTVIRAMESKNGSKKMPHLPLKGSPSGHVTPPSSPGRTAKDCDVMIAPFVPDVQITCSVYDVVRQVLCEGGMLGSMEGVDTLLKVWLATFPPLLPPTAANRQKFQQLQRSRGSRRAAGVGDRLSESSEHRAHVSSLVTVFFLIHTVLPHLRKKSHGPSVGEGRVLVGDTTQQYSLPAVLSEFCIDICGPADSIGGVSVDQWSEEEVGIFFDSYAVYVDLDVFAAACCIRKFAGALNKCLDMACKHSEVAASYNPFIERGSSHGGDSRMGIDATAALLFQGCVVENRVPSTLCILLAYMQHICEVSPAQAISLCASFYPLVQPWNMICVLGIAKEGEEAAPFCVPSSSRKAIITPRLTQYWDCVSLSESPDACASEDDMILLCSYLLRIASHKDDLICEDECVVHTLIDICLRVHSSTTALIGSEMNGAHTSSFHPVTYYTHIADLSAISSALLEVSPWQHDQGNQLLAIVRNIILRPDRYSYGSSVVADMCLRHGFFDGALEVVRLSLQRCGGAVLPERFHVPSLGPLLLNIAGDDSGGEIWDCVGAMDFTWGLDVTSAVMKEVCGLVGPMAAGGRSVDEIIDSHIGDMFCRACRIVWLLLCVQDSICDGEGDVGIGLTVAALAACLRSSASIVPRRFIMTGLLRALGKHVSELLGAHILWAESLDQET
jgi:hypothetical protein